MILVFPVGTPVVYSWLLWTRRDAIKNSVEERERDARVNRISFLYESYKPEFWWFEIFETCRRLALTGLLGAVQPGSIAQLGFGMLLSLAGIMTYCTFLPYRVRRDNFLGVLSNVQIFLVMMAALLLKFRGNVDSEDDGGGSGSYGIDEKGLGIMLVAVNSLGIATIILGGAINILIPTTSQEKSDLQSRRDVFGSIGINLSKKKLDISSHDEKKLTVGGGAGTVAGGSGGSGGIELVLLQATSTDAEDRPRAGSSNAAAFVCDNPLNNKRDMAASRSEKGEPGEP